MTGNGHDILAESHVEHAVGLVEHEEAHMAKVDVAHVDVADQTAGGGNNNIGTQFQAFHLLVVPVAIVSAVDGYAAHVFKVIAESLHRFVDLLGQLACGRHDNAVVSVGGVVAIVEQAQDGQQVGGSFASSCLSNSQQVVSVEYLRNTFFLDWCTCLETHVVERIENIIVEIEFVEIHIK